MEHFTSEMALKDISFHVKAKHKKVKQLVPKLTREHRAYIASKFDKMKFKETLPSPEVFAEHFRVRVVRPPVGVPSEWQRAVMSYGIR